LRIAIAGGSAAGLFAALLLARAGHDVVVLERDRLEPAADVESAAAMAFRPSAPQIVQPHLIMARCRQLLIERLPDVYAGMLAAGVAEAPLRTQMPDTLTDTAPRPGTTRAGSSSRSGSSDSSLPGSRAMSRHLPNIFRQSLLLIADWCSSS